MSIFYNKSNNEDELLVDEEFDMDEYIENCIYMELCGLPEADRIAISESDEVAVLEAKGLVGKKTFIRLNKNDDLTRRSSAAAYQLAKENNDPNWKKLVKAVKLKRAAKNAILKKWGPKAEKIARKTQKEFLKHPVAKLISKADLSATREKK